MKKATTSFALLAALLLIVLPSASRADEFTFSPIPADLYDLDHSWAYAWGLNWTIPSQEKIESASITFKNIYDWRIETGDILRVDLLDLDAGLNGYPPNNGWVKVTNPAYSYLTKTKSYNDGETPASDYFGTWEGVSVGTWTDSLGGNPRNPVFDLIFSIDKDTLTDYISNNSYFGFGIDPDCHYYNDGIVLKIVTGPENTEAPEPTSLFLLGTGLVGIGLAAWRRRK